MKYFCLSFFVVLFLVACQKDQEPVVTIVNNNTYDNTEDEEYIRYMIDTTHFEILDSLDAYPWFFSGASDATNLSVIAGNGDFILGNGSTSHKAINISFRNKEQSGIFDMQITKVHDLGLGSSFGWVKLTHFPKNTQEYYEGSFSMGQAKEAITQIPHDIAGTFRVRRRK